jgi:hypothetical protein
MLAITLVIGPKPKQVIQHMAKVTYPNIGQYYRSNLFLQLKKSGFAEYDVKKSIDYGFCERFK